MPFTPVNRYYSGVEMRISVKALDGYATQCIRVLIQPKRLRPDDLVVSLAQNEKLSPIPAVMCRWSGLDQASGNPGIRSGVRRRCKAAFTQRLERRLLPQWGRLWTNLRSEKQTGRLRRPTPHYPPDLAFRNGSIVRAISPATSIRLIHCSASES